MEETCRAFNNLISIVGIRFYAKENWNSKPWLMFHVINFIFTLFSFVFTTTFVATNFSDLLVFIEGACIWTTGVVMTLSIGVCLFFRNEFRNFIIEMAFKDSITEMPLIKTALKMTEGNKLMELKKLVEDSQVKLMTYVRLMMHFYRFICWLVWFLYLCSPIYIMIEQNDLSLRLLAFAIWFPWKLDDLRVYIGSFIFHAYCAWVSACIHPGLQCTIFLLIGQVIRRLRILAFILAELDELSMEIAANDPEKWKQCCKAVFTQCVQQYIILKKLSNKLNIICRPFYLMLILVAMLLVCMCSVKIAISDKLDPGNIKYYLHGFCYICVVLMFCLLGQQVQNECTVLENAVTEKWYIYDKSQKKNVMLFHNALGQQMPIYIFGSVTLSAPTFTWFIKTGMSFFTLVMSFFEE